MAELDTVNPGDVYRSFDALIVRTEQWIHSLPLAVDSCVDVQVKQRVVQRLVDLTNESYIERIGSDLQWPQSSRLNESFLSNENFRLNLTTGIVSMSKSFYIREGLKFLAHWGYVFFRILKCLLVSRERTTVSATILFEAGGGYKVNDQKLLKFIRSGPVRPLVESRQLVIKSTIQPTIKNDPDNVIYGDNPLIAYLEAFSGRSIRARTLKYHIIGLFVAIRALARRPLLIVIARDFVYLSSYAFLSKSKLVDAMVITNSSFANQELWMNGLCDQGHCLHMIWYSQNFIPKQYLGEVGKSNLPQARHIRVNAHWVWTNGFRDYLRSIGQICNIYSVGPLLWYLRDNESKLSLSARCKVILFDVTPVRASFKTFATTRNYYTFATISKFVRDSVDVCNELSSKYGVDIHVYLKHKRAIGSHHDPRYIEFIDDMLRFNDNFKVIDHEIDLFELIASANLSIAVPYTSTVSVSMFLEKKVIYYDSSGDLIPSYESFEGLSFVNSKTNLHSRIEEYISQQIK